MLISNIWDQIILIRMIKGGHWVKTKKRGWITLQCYVYYLGYGFDPIFVKEDTY